MVEHDLVAETDGKIVHANGWGRHRRCHVLHTHPGEEHRKNPSSRMTRKIDLTTEVVVCAPSDSALPLTANPSIDDTIPMTSAINGALYMPTSKWVTEIASCSRAMKIVGLMPA